jgi:vacuolar-type H+-ATPase subunit F/Vma7
MGVVAVIGNPARVRGWPLAGALVLEADTPDEARRAWADLSARGDVTVVVLDPAAEASLADVLDGEPAPGGVPLVAVMPE